MRHYTGRLADLSTDLAQAEYLFGQCSHPITWRLSPSSAGKAKRRCPVCGRVFTAGATSRLQILGDIARCFAARMYPAETKRATGYAWCTVLKYYARLSALYGGIAPRPIRHGVSRYQRQHCRCDVCRMAHRDDQRRCRAKRKEKESSIKEQYKSCLLQ